MEAKLRLETLGRFECQRDGKAWQSFESDKARALLVYLAVEPGRPHRRGHLAGLLWPDKPEQTARHSLSQALYSLRSGLDSSTGLFELTPQTVLFDPAGRVWVDIRAFLEAFQAAENHCPNSTWLCQTCTESLESAAALYQGEFLAGFSLQGCEAFESWLVQQRESLHQETLRLLARLANGFESRGDPESALRFAQRWTRLDEFNEGAFRQVMRLLAELGSEAEIRQQYQAFEGRLAQELAVEPEAETRALYRQIVSEIDKTPVQTRRFHFPHPLTPIVGRQVELDQVTRQLAQPGCRILTILGPGGVGKSRLAVEAGLKLQRLFRDGVCLVELNTQGINQGLLNEIAHALGLTQHTTIDLAGRQQTVDIVGQVNEFLNAKNVLLVLDGFEGLLGQASDLHHLLQHAPGVKALITSRARPNIKGETILFLDGLPLPPEDSSAIENPAVQLFHTTARRASPSFRPDDESLPAVVEICRLTHGLPLGILLAAAWSDILTPNQILKEVLSSLDFLSAGWRDLPERQRSLRATFDHSWRLLGADLQTAYLRLAVFRGAFSADRAQQVAEATLSQLKALVEYCLLQAAGEDRYRLHDLLRQYAQEKLSTNLDESRSVRERHCTVYMKALAAWEPRLKNREQFAALAEMDTEIAEVRAAWDWGVEVKNFALLEGGAWALYRFYTLKNRPGDGLSAFRNLAEHIQSSHRSPEKSTHWISATIKAAHFSTALPGKQNVWQTLSKVDALLADMDDRKPPFSVLHAETKLLMSLMKLWQYREHWQALALAEEGLTLMREYGTPWDVSYALWRVCTCHDQLGNLFEKKQLVKEGLTMQEAIGDPSLITELKTNLLYSHSLLGEAQAAIDLACEQNLYFNQVNTRQSRGYGIILLGLAHAHGGYFQKAKDYFAQAVILLKQAESWGNYEFSLYMQTFLGLHTGDWGWTRQVMHDWPAKQVFVIEPLLGIMKSYLHLLDNEYILGEAEVNRYLSTLQKFPRQDMYSQAFAVLAFIALQTGDRDAAHQHLLDAFENGLMQGYFIGLQVSLFVIGLILAEEEALEPAEAIKTLAEAQLAEKSVLFDELFGRRIAARTAALPGEQLQAAQARGREMDLFETAAAYLEKLKGADSLDAFLAQT